MTDVRYEANEAGLLYVTRSPFGPVGQDLRRRTINVNVAARRLAPRGPTVPPDKWSAGHRGGQLARSIQSEIVDTPSGMVGRVGSDEPYAMTVHEGSRPHVIRPRRKRYLRWREPPGYSDEVFSLGVRHPGNTRGRPFLLLALREAQF